MSIFPPPTSPAKEPGFALVVGQSYLLEDKGRTFYDTQPQYVTVVSRNALIQHFEYVECSDGHSRWDRRDNEADLGQPLLDGYPALARPLRLRSENPGLRLYNTSDPLMIHWRMHLPSGLDTPAVAEQLCQKAHTHAETCRLRIEGSYHADPDPMIYFTLYILQSGLSNLDAFLGDWNSVVEACFKAIVTAEVRPPSPPWLTTIDVPTTTTMPVPLTYSPPFSDVPTTSNPSPFVGIPSSFSGIPPLEASDPPRTSTSNSASTRRKK